MEIISQEPIPAWLLRPRRVRLHSYPKAKKSPTEVELCVLAFCILFLIYTTAYEVGFVEGRHQLRSQPTPATYIGLELKGSYAD